VVADTDGQGVLVRRDSEFGLLIDFEHLSGSVAENNGAMHLSLLLERLGGSPRRCFAPKVRVLARALVGRLQGPLPAGCRHAADQRLISVWNQRLGGSPRQCFAPKVRALGRAVAGRLEGPLPAGCRHAAEIAFGTSGWAAPPAVFCTEHWPMC